MAPCWNAASARVKGPSASTDPDPHQKHIWCELDGLLSTLSSTPAGPIAHNK